MMFIKLRSAPQGRSVCVGVDGSSFGGFHSCSHISTATNHGKSEKIQPRLNLEEKKLFLSLPTFIRE